MSTQLFFYFIVLSVGLICCQKPDATLFSLLDPSHTGITFENTITENDSFNILQYEYVYNGGGVALADFNRDHLIDVFFTGNMVSNQLYLNRGDFVFENVSKAANIEAADFWCSGVAIADVNQDGWEDIYISTNTYTNPARRTNLLFIHQGLNGEGIPTFQESAEAYGLADTSYAMNAVFFDYDNDLDLDVFVITNKELESRMSPAQYRSKTSKGNMSRIDRLYRQDFDEEKGHPVYSDVSWEAGIRVPGFSLGVNIVDINQDGWRDIYVSNDFISNDVLYINQGDGTFKDKANEFFKHTSHSAMGNDVADINNDGLLDLFTLDMLPEDNFRRKTMMGAANYMSYINNRRFGYDFQFVRNSLQLNQGMNPETGATVFSDISFFAGISATDWSWTPLIADFDHNGYRDIIITNGFPKDVTDRDFGDYQADVSAYAGPEFLLPRIPEIKIANYAFQNTGTLQFKEVSNSWGIDQRSFSNGAAYGDLDNDGDLDIVVNNINDSAFIYRNNLILETADSTQHYLRLKYVGPPSNPHALGTIAKVFYPGGMMVAEQNIYRGYLSSIEPTVHFGLGAYAEIDSLVVVWPDGSHRKLTKVEIDQVLEIIWDDSNTVREGLNKAHVTTWLKKVNDTLQLNFVHEELDYVDYRVQPLLPHKFTQFGPGIAVGDVNHDGKNDLYIGGSYAKSGTLYMQNEEGTFSQTDFTSDPEMARSEDMGALFFDADNDGDDDLYIVSGGYEFNLDDSFYYDRFYLNEAGSLTLTEGMIPPIKSSGSCVRAADYDKDGDLDLFVGGRVWPHNYPKPVNSYIFQNTLETGTPGFRSVIQEIAPDLQSLGMVSDALWSDYDQDGWIDLIIAGELMPITFLKNIEGIFENVTAETGCLGYTGWWNSLAAGDYDGDGDIDYAAGNYGSNLLFNASKEQPLRVYGKDFDDNGGFDAIVSAYFKSVDGTFQEFPIQGRSDVAKQMIFVVDKFPLHQDFATATMQEIFSTEQLEGCILYEANHLESSLLRNNGDGTFEVIPLPKEAQFAPVYSMSFSDLDADNSLDLMLVGNDFGMELIGGRCDALNGLILKGENQAGFTPLSIGESGFFAPGDAKGMAKITSQGEEVVLVGQNQGPLLAYATNTSRSDQVIPLESQDAYVTYSYGGKSLRIEGHYGSGFLSQSERVVRLPENAKEIRIVDFQGNKRLYLPIN